MRESLKQLYIQPEHWGYRFLETTYTYWRMISLICMVTILAYPLFLWGEQIYRQQDLQHKLTTQQARLSEQIRLHQSMLQHYHKQNPQDAQLSQLNQQLKMVFEQHHATIDTLQWRFDHGKHIEFAIQQESNTIFRLLTQLNQLEKLHFQRISLLKLHRQRLLQLTAELKVH